MKGLNILALLLVAVGICEALTPSYLSWTYVDKSSEEDGQFAGPKRTNCSCGTTYRSAGRIVGGRLAKPNEYPHMVGVAKRTMSGGLGLFCGATIITNHHVLTAAHCTADLKSWDKLVIMVGGHDTQMPTRHTKFYDVSVHFEHPLYNPKTYANDIAMLVLVKPIIFNEAVGPACLPKSPMNSQLVGKYVKVSGWGDTQFEGESSQYLLKVNLRVVPLDECADTYLNIRTTNPTQFCTYRNNKDSCQGDSGGPVTWLDPDTNRFTLVGVVSYGRGCATLAPGVNTDVFAFMPWIQETIAMTSQYTTSGSANTCAKIG